jgi:hypothetical protein
MVNTPLAKLYQEMVDHGVIVPPNKDSTQFLFPSLLNPVPSFTTYGVPILLEKDLRVELESSPIGNQR